jgi:hypothetical protein
MRQIALVARQDLTYGARTVAAGEPFEATPLDAAVLTYRRQASFAPRAAAMESAAPPRRRRAPVRQRRKTIRRRDLVPEE